MELDEGGRKRKAIEFPVAKAEGLKVRPLWLIVSHTERYLMLEDVDTGDVLLPLIYMKSMFEANYSRKLSSLKHRIVALPERFAGDKRGFVYWQWAFESPHEVKVLVRKMLGEENTPQGHLRLILVPIVFNAMAQKAKLRECGFFKKLEAAVRSSTYWPLLKIPLGGPEMEPRLEAPQISEEEIAEVAVIEAGTPLNGEEQPQTEEAPKSDGIKTTKDTEPPYDPSKAEEAVPKPLFHGPYDLQKTVEKYCLSYEAVEAAETRKTARFQDVVSTQQQYEDEMVAFNTLEYLKEQNETLRHEMSQMRLDFSRQIMNVNLQVQDMKESIVTLVSKLDKGSLFMQSNGISHMNSMGQDPGNKPNEGYNHTQNFLHPERHFNLSTQQKQTTQSNYNAEVDLRLGPSWAAPPPQKPDDSLSLSTINTFGNIGNLGNFGTLGNPGSYGNYGALTNAPNVSNYGHLGNISVKKETSGLLQNLTQAMTLAPNSNAGQASWHPAQVPKNTPGNSQRLPHWLTPSSNAGGSMAEAGNRHGPDASTLQNQQRNQQSVQAQQLNQTSSRGIQQLFNLHLMQQPPQ